VANGSDELVRLTIVANEIEADQIQQLLKFEDIESMQRLTNYGAGAIDAGSSMAGAREILVKSEDLDNARTVIGDE
jgi:Putative prokaryotic signal transducing protein